MKTSYFAKMRKIDKEDENASKKYVAVTQKIPGWYNGRVYRKLAPTWTIIKLKNDPKKYEEIYRKEILGKLNAKEVYNILGNDAILLCYEKSEDFCHRHIIAKWLNEELGIDVNEY